jgi:hypothetical protein
VVLKVRKRVGATQDPASLPNLSGRYHDPCTKRSRVFYPTRGCTRLTYTIRIFTGDEYLSNHSKNVGMNYACSCPAGTYTSPHLPSRLIRESGISAIAQKIQLD